MLARRLHVVAAGAAWVAMFGYPAGRRGGAARRVLSSVVIGGLFTTTTIGSARRWGPSRSAFAAIGGVCLGAAAEHVGVRTGRPFGRYAYSSALRPRLGGVPVVVPLAWFSMAVPAREAAHAALGRRSNRCTRLVVGAAALTAWDLFLDPQMVGEGFWAWARPGRYRGIPLSNFVGWFAVGLAMMAVLEHALPAGEPAVDLVAEYGVMAAMETVAFGALFRDPVVAIAGGAGMLPVAAVAAARLVGQRT